MRLRFTSDATAHISSIHDFLAERNPAAARRVLGKIRVAVNRLREFPYLGHVGDEPGTREWVARGLPYVIVYRVDVAAGEVTVLGVFHGAQQRGGLSEKESE